MLPEARDKWVEYCRLIQAKGLEFSILLDVAKDFATANGLTELITESVDGASPVLIGTNLALADALAMVNMSASATVFLDDPVVPDGLSRKLFLRRII